MIKGTIENGRIVPSEPIRWPNGTEVAIDALEEDRLQGDDPESIADWIAWYQSLEPLIMSPEEEAAWRDERAARKAFEESHFDGDAERLGRMWP